MTAQDETTANTYLVTVTRRASMLASCESDALWCATLTVGLPSSGGSSGYCGTGTAQCDYGRLDIAGFTLDQTGYTVQSLRWEANNTHLTLDKAFPDPDLPFLTLGIGAYSLALADAIAGNNGSAWPTPEGFPALGAGQPVTVQLWSRASADANLSGLALADDDGGVALDKEFDPVEAVYAASVANDVGQVTVTPATSHAFATVEYLDGVGNALADADMVEDGHQVALEVGYNVVQVRVTAQDETTANTYMVTVTRRASMLTACHPDAVWCAVMTTGVSSDGREMGYCRQGCNFGSLDIGGGFTLDQTDYTVQSVRLETDDNRLSLDMDKAFPTSELEFLTLRIGTRSVALADAIATNPGAVHWPDLEGFPALGAGDPVTVQLSSGSSTDATLSGLALAHDGASVALIETFDPGELAYTASAANSVDQVTVTPATSHAFAEVEYLDDASAALADADPAAGQQVDLEAGDNVIAVKVTAQDETTTQTYTVTVNRAAFACEVPDLSGLTQAWAGTLTVGEIAGGDVYGYFPGANIGELSSTTFNGVPHFEGVPRGYEIDAVAVNSDDGGLTFSLNRELAGVDYRNLLLHVCDAQFALGDATYSGDQEDDYIWSGAGLHWSSATTVELALSLETPNDASLSALALADDDGAAVALNETFAPNDTVYTASVANPVRQVTVTPATSDAFATVEYLDGNDNPLIDGGAADGQQVDLEVGENVIKVRVTAQDETTMRTYTVTVNRAAFACAVPDLAGLTPAWAGTVTVERISGGVNDGYFPDGAIDVGALSDTDFNGVSSPYVIDGVVVNSGDGRLTFSLGGQLDGVDSRHLLLHVCDARFALGDANYNLLFHDYDWPGAGLDWSTATMVELALSLDPPNDAAMSALALADDDGAAVALNETFDPNDTVYTASVANLVRQVTVTPATSDAFARVDYLDDAGVALADADPAAGHQVDLEAGDNVIDVKVTAQDGSTSKTYRLTVNREEFVCAAPDLAGLTQAWAGTVTVGSIDDVVHGYSDASFGGLSGDAMFLAVSNSYAIDGVSVDSDDGVLTFSLTGELAGAEAGFLSLHVCDAQFALGDATYSADTSHDYAWSGAGLDWSAAAEVKLALSLDVATDATLSALELADDYGRAIALNETFDPDALAYTATVANPVEQVTVTPAANAANAAVEILDGEGDALVDADSVADGHQVNLVLGDNVIAVAVKAQDARTARTYRLTVSRAAFVCAATDLAGRPEVWSGSLTVGESIFSSVRNSDTPITWI